MPSKKYKLYKDGKSLVIGAIAVAGVMATTGVSQVHADTVKPSDTAQTVQTASTAQSDKQVTLQPAQSADTTVKTDTTQAVKSDVATTIPASATQDDAKKAVDTAQDAVKGNVNTAQNAGVNVTTGATQDVTINNDNAVSKTNGILSDLNKQDQAVKQATATQVANQNAYDTATKDHDEAVKQGQSDLGSATDSLNKQVDATQKAGIDVSVALSKTSPQYQSLQGLTGQELLDAMAKNISLYKEAIASGVAFETADTVKLGALVAEYQKNQADFAQATNDRDATLKQGQTDLATAQANLDKAVAEADQSGIKVSTALSELSPEYRSLNGLVGQALLDAMAYNIDLYNKAIASGVATQDVDTATLRQLTTEYQAKYADYMAKKTAVDKANADKKAAYDKLVLDRQAAINAAIAKGDQHYTGSYDLHGYYGGFLNGVLHFDYTYHWDATKNTFVVTKVSYTFDSAAPDKTGNGFWDSVYVQGPKSEIPQDSAKGNIQNGADLVENGDTLWNQVKDANYGVMFFLSQNNKTGQVTTHVDNTSFVPYEAVQLPDGSFELARFIVRNRQGDPSVTNSEYAKWIEADKVVLQSDIPVEPTTPTYEEEPSAPEVPTFTANKVTVVELPTPETPVAPTGNATKVTVDELPQAEAPAPQQVDVHYYNVSTTPDVPAPTATPVTPAPKVVEASILPHTGASEKTGSSMLSVLAGISGLGLLGAIRKFKKQ